MDLLDPDDNQLLALAKGGDKQAYGELVKRYQKLVYNVVFQLLGEVEATKDMTQETFLKAYRALPTFQNGAPLRPWLLRIATNSSLNYLRDNKRSTSLDELIEVSPGAEPTCSKDLDREIDSELLQAKLTSVLRMLKAEHRQVLILKYRYDLSYEEIGEIIGEPVTSVKSLLFRIRSKVRSLMGQ